MGSDFKTPRSCTKREGKEEVGGKLLTDSLITEIDRLGTVSQQAAETAKIYHKLFAEIRSVRLKVDITPFEPKRQELVQEMDDRIDRMKDMVKTQERFF